MTIYHIKDIINPLGNSAGLGTKGLILQAYEQRYFILKDRIQWACTIYGEAYIIHIRIPSESRYCPDVFYDVVFQFNPNNINDKKDKIIDNYALSIYSNTPSFTFTFTYAFNKYKLLIPWLKDKCSIQCLTKPAVIRNPNSIIGTDMKTWFAAYHIKRIGLLNKERFKANINVNINRISGNVLSQDQMLRIRILKEKAGKENIRIAHSNKTKEMNNMIREEYTTGKKIEKQIAERNTKVPLENRIDEHLISKKLAKQAIQSKYSISSRNPRQSRMARKYRK